MARRLEARVAFSPGRGKEGECCSSQGTLDAYSRCIKLGEVHEPRAEGRRRAQAASFTGAQHSQQAGVPLPCLFSAQDTLNSLHLSDPAQSQHLAP